MSNLESNVIVSQTFAVFMTADGGTCCQDVAHLRNLSYGQFCRLQSVPGPQKDLSFNFQS